MHPRYEFIFGLGRLLRAGVILGGTLLLVFSTLLPIFLLGVHIPAKGGGSTQPAYFFAIVSLILLPLDVIALRYVWKNWHKLWADYDGIHRDPPVVNVSYENLAHPDERIRRETIERGSLDIENVLQKFSDRLQAKPLPTWDGALVTVMSVGWFAAKSLLSFRKHDDADVRQFAELLLQKLVALVPPPVRFESPDPEVLVLAAAAFNRQGVQIAGREPLRALEYFEHASTLVPTEAPYLGNMASVLLKLERFAAALVAVERAIGLQQDKRLIVLKGEILTMLNRYDDARKCFVEAHTHGVKGMTDRILLLDSLMKHRQ